MTDPKPGTPESALRAQLADLLEWRSAHVDFDAATRDLPAELRGARPAGLPHSPWQLLEHMRRAQRDILDFCRDPEYVEPKWPEDYWPDRPDPPDPGAWDASVTAFRADLAAVKSLATDPGVDLFAVVPNGDDQTFLREILLVADHNAYHLGQLVMLRRLLGAWDTGS